MCAYLIFSINTLYSSNSIKISDEYKSVVNLVKDYSNNIVNNFHIVNSYGMFDDIEGKTRPELEILVKDKSNTWEHISYKHKISVMYEIPRFIIPHQPRIDYQLIKAAKSEDIICEGWLTILLGKIIEKNPVILDLLGYYISHRDIYYKCNI